MKLGEALSLRAKQAQQLDDLRGRIRTNALTQEGDEPAEDPGTLIDAFLELSGEHSVLVRRIAMTNAATEVGGEILLDLLHRREVERRARSIHEAAANAGTSGSSDRYRYMRSELRYVSNIDVAVQRELAEARDAKVRELDVQIQEANWQVELL